MAGQNLHNKPNIYGEEVGSSYKNGRAYRFVPGGQATPQVSAKRRDLPYSGNPNSSAEPRRPKPMTASARAQLPIHGVVGRP
eukprot:14459458-Alexandrium_andersonii.AAC.1